MIRVGVVAEKSLRNAMENKNMPKVYLRKVIASDKKYFAKWWRDKQLLKRTSGNLRRTSDREIDKYFRGLFDERRHDYIIMIGKKIVGHIPLIMRKNGWYETMIVIGEKKFQDKGYGTQAMKLLLAKTLRTRIPKIYLRVRQENLRAIRMYEKCGFIKNRIIKYPKNKFLPKVLKMVWRQ